MWFLPRVPHSAADFKRYILANIAKSKRIKEKKIGYENTKNKKNISKSCLYQLPASGSPNPRAVLASLITVSSSRNQLWKNIQFGPSQKFESSSELMQLQKRPGAEHKHDKTTRSDVSQMSNGPKIKYPTKHDISC